jgi:hypothetical protein
VRRARRIALQLLAVAVLIAAYALVLTHGILSLRSL